MASLESYGVDEYGNSNGVNLPDFTGCLLLATTPTPPAGTLVADGSEVSREAYAKLFTIFGTQYGAGDGETTFALPDWRDEFPRFSGSARAVLTTQGDAIRNITGYFIDYIFQPEAAIGGQYIQNGSGVFKRGNDINKYGSSITINSSARQELTPPVSDGMIFDASTVVPTADENRPRNIAFLPCVIYE